MAHRRLTKSHSKRVMGLEMDRISDLPSDILEKILSQLPIRDVVRTSVLSTQWKCKSAMLHDLVFDDQCFSTQRHTTFANIVDHVLLLHTGPRRKFKLSRRELLATRDIDRWVTHLSKNCIRELILDIWKGDHYEIPSCLFSCQDLVRLELLRCLLKPPPTFTGFKSLKSIDIEDVTMAQDVFEDLIVYSPLLERLSVRNCEGFTHLNVAAPNLHQFMAVGSVFDDFNLEKTLNLNTVYIDFDVKYEERQDIDAASSSNLVKFFKSLPHIRSLDIQSNFLKYLAVGDVPRELPELCLSLNFLSVGVNLNNSNEIRAVLCLLRSSPALQELHILGYQEDEDTNIDEAYSWLDHDNQNCQSTHSTQLRLMKITGVTGVKAELDFIELLLSSSPLLKTLTIHLASGNDLKKITKTLLPFGRLSKRAETIYLDLVHQ